MSAKVVKLLGEPILRAKSVPVGDVNNEDFLFHKMNLLATLDKFRKEMGFGRAISAPQIGISMRFIALNLGDDRGFFTLINPKILWASSQMITVWDDCMSFPWIMVKVARHKSITIQYIDEKGFTQEMRELDVALSELLQHEIDHLDGVLALDRAIDSNSVISREIYERDRSYFDSQVDYFIVPTIKK